MLVDKTAHIFQALLHLFDFILVASATMLHKSKYDALKIQLYDLKALHEVNFSLPKDGNLVRNPGFCTHS